MRLESAPPPAALFEIRHYDWRELHEGTFAPPSNYLELTQIRAVGNYARAERGDWYPLGRIRFIPAAHEFQSRWMDDDQDSFCCALDIFHLTGMELVQHFSAVPAPRRSRGNRLSQIDVERMGARLREERDPPPDLTALANEQGLSARHFSRLFKAAAGESIGAFSSRQRSLRGQDLLGDPRLLIKDVASQCGFASAAAFCTAFRSASGMSSQEYRRRRAASGGQV